VGCGLSLGRLSAGLPLPSVLCKHIPIYIGNTIVGLITLLGGVLGIIADLGSVQALLAVFVGLTALGVLAAWRMPEAEYMVTPGNS
jgi:hypothetical protein